MINLIFSETKRSLVYLKELYKNKYKLNLVIIYSKKKSNVYNYVKERKLAKFLIRVKSDDINSLNLKEKFKLSNKSINIVSTYPGEIVRNKYILKFQFLHCHPGNLPKFRGSTIIYYTILLKNKICVSLFKIRKEIDSGEIVFKKFFDYPKKIIEIEKNFDHQIRAKTLISYLKQRKKIKFKKSKKKYLPYYIIHPVLRALVHHKTYFNKSASSL